MKIYLCILYVLLQQLLSAQPMVPTGKIKIMDYGGDAADNIGVIVINSSEEMAKGQVQYLSKKLSDGSDAMAKSSNWQLIHKGSDIFLIQNVENKKYLGVLTSQYISEQQPHVGWFVVVNELIADSSFYWKISYHKRHKKGANVEDYLANEPYNKSNEGWDVFNIMNCYTKSRLSSMSVGGILFGDLTIRVCVQGTPECGSIKTANGQRLGTSSNNEWDSRFYLIAESEKPGIAAYTLLRGYCKPLMPNGKPVTSVKTSENGATKNDKSKTVNSQTQEPKPNLQPSIQPAPSIKADNELNISGMWLLTKTEMYSIKNGARKKLPGLLNILAGKKLELKFMNGGLLEVKNKETSQTLFYNWQIKDNNILSMIPKNKEEDSFIGIVRFEGNKMIHIINEGNKETEYIYEKK